MSNKEEDQRQQQQMMKLSWGNKSKGLSNFDKELSNMDLPHIVGSSSNNNNNLLLLEQNDEEGGGRGGINIESDRTTLRKRSRGGKRSVGSSTGDGKDRKKGGNGKSSDHKIHIWMEKERRSKIRNMFTNLHTMLPQLPSKAKKSIIVDEAINYIKSLENSIQKLEKQKMERLQQLQSTTTIVYDPSGNINSHWHPYKSREAFIADQGSSINNSSTSNNNSKLATPNTINIGTLNPSTSLSIPRLNNGPVRFQTWASSNVVLNIYGDQAQFNVCYPKKPGIFTDLCYVLEKHKIEVLSAHIVSNDNQTMCMIQAQANGASNQFQEAFSMEEIFRQATEEIMLWLSQNFC